MAIPCSIHQTDQYHLALGHIKASIEGAYFSKGTTSTCNMVIPLSMFSKHDT